MIFTLSSKVSTVRKVGYYGMFFVVWSVLLVKILVGAGGFDREISWAATLFITGLSLISIAVSDGLIRKQFDRFGSLTLFAFSMFIPILISVIVYVVLTIAGESDFAHVHVMEGMAGYGVVAFAVCCAAIFIVKSTWASPLRNGENGSGSNGAEKS